MLQWKQAEEFVPINSSVNVFVVAFTTANARLHLYNIMEAISKPKQVFRNSNLNHYWAHHMLLYCIRGLFCFKTNGLQNRTFDSLAQQNLALHDTLLLQNE